MKLEFWTNNESNELDSVQTEEKDKLKILLIYADKYPKCSHHTEYKTNIGLSRTICFKFYEKEHIYGRTRKLLL